MKKIGLSLATVLFLATTLLSQEPLKLEEGKKFYYKNSGGSLVGLLVNALSVAEATMKNVDQENLTFTIDVPTDYSNTTNISFRVQENTFSSERSEELGLIDSVGIKFNGYRWDAIYISEMDKLVLYWTSQYAYPGQTKPEHIDIQFVLGTDKEEMKKYKIDEEKACAFIADYHNKLDSLLPILREKKQAANKKAEEDKKKKHFEEELEASKDRTLPDFAIEKGFELEVCKEYWKDGEVLQTWKSENQRGWGVTKDEYNMPLYKSIYVLMLIKSEDGHCYLINNTLK